MATLVFGALGTLVGGPVGGAIGSLLGRALDRQIIGIPSRQGPRLTELAVSSSSYGLPIARQYGTMRAAGTIVWATDLKESSETASGGKGQPKTTRYSYSVSLAVALSSRPIGGVGRIWADGNLLRGAAGDLKTGGSLRIHLGHADQPRDPLLAAALGSECPAHRGLAYVVFEDLQLGDFGNRIPALSFEVFADGAGEQLIPALARTAGAAGQPVPDAAPILGFAHDGGSLAAVFDLLGDALPLAADARGNAVAIGPTGSAAGAVALPAAIAWPDGEFGTRTGSRHARGDAEGATALRYYDVGRDFQPGLQRAAGRPPLSGERILELPAALDAAGARGVADAIRLRARANGERLQIRVGALDPAIAPGAIVAVPGEGLWRLEAWEWRSGGVELDLTRAADISASPRPGDTGAPWRPADRLPAATLLDAFELPWDGAGAPDAMRVHVALSAGGGRWAGASLYVERAGALLALDSAGPVRSVTGMLTAPLAPSPALIFEPAASLDLVCDDPESAFATADGAALAAGANHLLVGDEIVQFMHADPLGGGAWRLSGLLRGRGATEVEARVGHLSETRAILLDDRLHLLDGANLDAASERLAAIGSADPAPVFAAVRSAGRSRRPLSPVHPAVTATGSGLTLEWTRRARGAWMWRDGVETPLVEEAERYEVFAGPWDAPLAVWPTPGCALTLADTELAALPPGTQLWVMQIGSHARSPALLLHTLA